METLGENGLKDISGKECENLTSVLSCQIANVTRETDRLASLLGEYEKSFSSRDLVLCRVIRYALSEASQSLTEINKIFTNEEGF